MCSPRGLSRPRGRRCSSTRPDAIRDIFAGDPDVFHAGEANSILGLVMGELSLLLVDGAQHKQARRSADAGLRWVGAMRGYEDLVTDVASPEVALISPRGRAAALDRMNALTLEVILRVCLRRHRATTRLGSLRAPSSRRRSTSTPRSSSAAPSPPGAGGRHVAPGRRDLSRHSTRTSSRRDRRAPRRRRPRGARRRALDAAPGPRRDGEPLTDRELRDQLVTLLFAGHETTATTIGWASSGSSAPGRARARSRGRPRGRRWLEAVSRRRCGCTRSSRWSCAPLRSPDRRRVRPSRRARPRRPRSSWSARPGALPRAGDVPARALPRTKRARLRLAALRRRRAALHRRRLLAPRGRRRPARGVQPRSTSSRSARTSRRSATSRASRGTGAGRRVPTAAGRRRRRPARWRASGCRVSDPGGRVGSWSR